jgi:RNA polymerase sigma factor (sigma-70 family)
MSPRISIRLLAGQSDERLVALVREGHERAFEALVHRYRRPLLRYCRRRMRLGDARAEDVVQQSLLKAWLALARGTEVRDLKPWLYGIVHNTALNSMRDSADSEVALSEARHPDATAVEESELERQLDVRDALAHVAELPSLQRQAMLLTAVEGQTHDEVATTLGISQGAVRGLLHRARTTLRAAATAITPQPLIGWASGATDATTPGGGRLAESAAGGLLGLTGVLKGAAVAVSVGVLVGGAAAVHLRKHDAASSKRGQSSERGASSAAAVADAGGGGSIGAAVASSSSAPQLGRADLASSGHGRTGSSAGARHPAARRAPALPVALSRGVAPPASSTELDLERQEGAAGDVSGDRRRDGKGEPTANSGDAEGATRPGGWGEGNIAGSGGGGRQCAVSSGGRATRDGSGATSDGSGGGAYVAARGGEERAGSAGGPTEPAGGGTAGDLSHGAPAAANPRGAPRSNG